jgi:hypothetical protein
MTGPLRDELRELASMPFWRTAVAPWIRPVHLTIIVSDGLVPDGIGRGQCAPRMALLVSYSFPGVAPGEFSVSISTLSGGAGADAARKELVDWGYHPLGYERSDQQNGSSKLLRDAGLTCKLETSHSVWIGPFVRVPGDYLSQYALRVCL